MTGMCAMDQRARGGTGAARLWRRLMQWAFARLYHECAWSYDLVAALVSRGLWSRWVVTALPYLHGARVLELGSGTGYLQRALAQARVWSVGLDESWPMLRLARRKVAHAGLAAWLLRGDARWLPFRDAVFSDVVATFPAPYILDPRTIADIRRVLQPGGRLVLVDGARLLRRDVSSAAIAAAYRATGQTYADDPRPALLQQAGFALEEHWERVGPSVVQILRATKT